jgi:hypothetical protein
MINIGEKRNSAIIFNEYVVVISIVLYLAIIATIYIYIYINISFFRAVLPVVALFFFEVCTV